MIQAGKLVSKSEMNFEFSQGSSDGRRIVPVITEAIPVTGLGNNLEGLWHQLMKGASAIKPVNRFAVDNYSAKVAACIQDLKSLDNRSLIHSLLDRVFSSLGPVAPDTFLITATTKAGIDALEKIQRGQPADVRDVTPSALTETINRRFNLSDAGLNISAACASSTVATARAAAMIAAGRTEAALVCCADIVTEFVFSGFSALKALSSIPCRPFDRRRNGLSLGEGAAALMMMSAKPGTAAAAETARKSYRLGHCK